MENYKMENLSNEEIQKAVINYIHRKSYYSNYQKVHKDEVNNNTKKYLQNIKDDIDKLEKYKQKKKEYYERRGKELAKARYLRIKEEKKKLDNKD